MDDQRCCFYYFLQDRAQWHNSSWSPLNVHGAGLEPLKYTHCIYGIQESVEHSFSVIFVQRLNRKKHVTVFFPLFFFERMKIFSDFKPTHDPPQPHNNNNNHKSAQLFQLFLLFLLNSELNLSSNPETSCQKIKK